MSVRDLDHIYVETKQYERAVAFWRALGFEVAAEWGEGEHRACRLAAGGAAVVLAQVGPRHHAQGPVVHLAIDDAEALDARLAADDAVEIVTPLEATHWGTRWIRVLDPDGNAYALEAPRE